MIVLYHKNNKVVSVRNLSEETTIPIRSVYASKALFEIASLYPKELVSWCHISQKEYLNIASFSEIFHHQKIMASYHQGAQYFLSDAIGYVEQSPFIKVSKKVSYPTWQMGSSAGGIFASVINALPNNFSIDNNFDFFLNSLSKQSMPIGLLCYSEPRLLIPNDEMSYKSGNNFDLFRFVKQHFKTRWVFLLFLNLLVYEKKVRFFPFVYCLFFKKRVLSGDQFDTIVVSSSKNVVSSSTIDVIIPTIGRKQYLYDVLCDLKKQTHLPTTVIIVEQNSLEGSTSELDYLINEDWPFKIDLTFTHQAGACNARNIALSKVKSEWVFLNDDDNRFDSDLLSEILLKIQKFGITVATTSYLLSNEVKDILSIHQSAIFGSGNSFLKSKLLENVRFDFRYEFGYGEDSDFGFQLRKSGNDIIYFPVPYIVHLKAPMGGYRIPVKKDWCNEKIQPLPSPSVLLNKMLHMSKEQIFGYKMIYFIKLTKSQISFKNLFVLFSKFKASWRSSIYWTNVLKEKNEG